MTVQRKRKQKQQQRERNTRRDGGSLQIHQSIQIIMARCQSSAMGIFHQQWRFWQWSSILLFMIVLVLEPVELPAAAQVASNAQDRAIYLHEEPIAPNPISTTEKTTAYKENWTQSKKKTVDNNHVWALGRLLQEDPTQSEKSEATPTPMAIQRPLVSVDFTEPPTPSKPPDTPTPSKSGVTLVPIKSEDSPPPSESKNTPTPPKSSEPSTPSKSEDTPVPTKSEDNPPPSESKNTPTPPKSSEPSSPSKSEDTPVPTKSEETPPSSESTNTPTPPKSSEPTTPLDSDKPPPLPSSDDPPSPPNADEPPPDSNKPPMDSDGPPPPPDSVEPPPPNSGEAPSPSDSDGPATPIGSDDPLPPPGSNESPPPPSSGEPPAPPSPDKPPAPPSVSEPPAPSSPVPQPQSSQSTGIASTPDLNSLSPPSAGDSEASLVMFDSSCTAPDPALPIDIDCTIVEGGKVLAYLDDLRAERGLPPFDTSPLLLQAVRFELLTVVGCEVCDERAVNCYQKCGSKPEQQRPSCNDTCEDEYGVCRETECSPLVFLNCCKCSDPTEPYFGRQLQGRTPSRASCSRVESRLPSPRTAGNNLSKNKEVFDRRNRCAACATARLRNVKIDGWEFVTLCRVCRRC